MHLLPRPLPSSSGSWWQRYQVLIACVISTATVLAIAFLGNFFEIGSRLVVLETNTAHTASEISEIKASIEKLDNKVEGLDDKIDSILIALVRSGLNFPETAQSLQSPGRQDDAERSD